MSDSFESKENPMSFLKYGVILLLVIVGGIMLFGNISDNTVETSSVIKNGENGLTNTNTYVAANEEIYDEMIGYFDAENIDALNLMEARGNIVYVPKGTKVTVVDRGFLKTKVEVIENGIRGYIITEFVEK